MIGLRVARLQPFIHLKANRRQGTTMLIGVPKEIKTDAHHHADASRSRPSVLISFGTHGRPLAPVSLEVDEWLETRHA